MILLNRFFAFALATLLMSASGCVCVSNRGVSGNVAFSWSFGGNPCALVPDIASVTIQIPGETLNNQGVYSCLNSGSPGIVLLKFRPGTYSYTIQGRNNLDQVIYAGAGTFVVNGDVGVNVNLQPSGSPSGAVLVHWNLPGNRACADAVPGVQGGIGFVDIVVDGATPSRQACNAGIVGSQGLTISSLTAGTHTVELRAFATGSQFQYLGTINSVAITAGGTIAAEFSLAYTVGSLPLKWQFLANGVAVSCEQLGNPAVYVNLKDSTGVFVYRNADGSDSPGYSVPCKDSQGIQGARFPYLYGGSYQLFIQTVANSVLYRSNQTNPPTVVVTSGVFPNLDNGTFVFNVTSP